MVSFGEKSKIKKAGNLNEGRSYVITTVLQIKVEVKYENLTNVIVVTFKKLSEFLHHHFF